jgi:hypothetical protein
MVTRERPLLRLVLLFYSLSVALGAEESDRAIAREGIAEAVHSPATWVPWTHLRRLLRGPLV